MDMLTGILKAIFFGLLDSLKGTVAIYYLDKNIKERADQRSPLKDLKKDVTTPTRKKSSQAGHSLKKNEQPKILRRTLQCCLLNGGVFWLSILLFNCLLLPGLGDVVLFLIPQSGQVLWAYLEPFLQWVFGTFWVLPLFLLSKVVNALWFQDIADSAFRYSRGTPQHFSSISKLVADSLFSILVQVLFLAQTMLVGLLPIPILADLLSVVHMCMLYALYSFEYKWCNMGWELHHRLTFIENNWPYFIGFGLPLSVLTGLPSSLVVSGCVFSILFPLFIISGNEADPVINVCDSRLKLFSPVIIISNALFNRTIGVRSASR